MVLTVLSVTPEFVVSRTRSARVAESSWRSGIHHVATLTPYAVREWSLVWHRDAGPDRTAVRAMWDAMRGPSGVFSWTPPGGSAVAVRFATDDLSAQQFSASAHAFTVRLQEALNHDG